MKRADLTTLLSPQTIFNLLVTALEGGSNYWYYLADLSMLPPKSYVPNSPEIEKGFETCLVSRIWEAVCNGETIPVYDIENEDEELGKFNIESINKGLELMLQEGSEHFADALAENEDADTGDIFFQFCVMGEVVFG